MQFKLKIVLSRRRIFFFIVDGITYSIPLQTFPTSGRQQDLNRKQPISIPIAYSHQIFIICWESVHTDCGFLTLINAIFFLDRNLFILTVYKL